jgi:YidC/Oxa1 family membrane protein insertase
MNKNTLLAFSLILLILLFFNSPFYNKFYEKIFNKTRVTTYQTSDQTLPTTGKEAISAKRDTVYLNPQEIIKKTETINTKKDSLLNDQQPHDTIWVENEKVICGISEEGAKIISLKMKDYLYGKLDGKNDSNNKYVDLVSNSDSAGGNLTINGMDYDFKKFNSQQKEKKIFILKGENKTIDFIYSADEKTRIIKRYSFEGDSYKIGFTILDNSLDGKSVMVGWKGGIIESENQGTKSNSASGVIEPKKVHCFDTKNVSHFQMKKIEKDEESGFYKWAAITSKYFMIAIVADTVKNTDLLIQAFNTNNNTDSKKAIVGINYGIQLRRTAEGSSESYWIYAGPSKFLLIKSYKEKFEKVLFGGWEILLRADLWFPYICEWTLWLLIFLNGVFKDYGITIIVLTIITRVITLPLSHSSMKSMSRMKDLQPKINHLKERYKTNPKKMNEETMALYKKEGINPFNPGCLPMFLQMPILFALFVVLRKAIELRGAQTILIPWVSDLSQPESLISLTSIFPNGIPMYGSSIALLPILMAILTFIQNKMTIKDPNQKMMIYFMPIFMLVLFNNFPAGLVLYWTFSNALGIIQQYVLDKSIKDKAVAAPVETPLISKGKKR